MSDKLEEMKAQVKKMSSVANKQIGSRPTISIPILSRKSNDKGKGKEKKSFTSLSSIAKKASPSPKKVKASPSPKKITSPEKLEEEKNTDKQKSEKKRPLKETNDVEEDEVVTNTKKKKSTKTISMAGKDRRTEMAKKHPIYTPSDDIRISEIDLENEGLSGEDYYPYEDFQEEPFKSRRLFRTMELFEIMGTIERVGQEEVDGKMVDVALTDFKFPKQSKKDGASLRLPVLAQFTLTTLPLRQSHEKDTMVKIIILAHDEEKNRLYCCYHSGHRFWDHYANVGFVNDTLEEAFYPFTTPSGIGKELYGNPVSGWERFRIYSYQQDKDGAFLKDEKGEMVRNFVTFSVITSKMLTFFQVPTQFHGKFLSNYGSSGIRSKKKTQCRFENTLDEDILKKWAEMRDAEFAGAKGVMEFVLLQAEKRRNGVDDEDEEEEVPKVKVVKKKKSTAKPAVVKTVSEKPKVAEVEAEKPKVIEQKKEETIVEKEDEEDVGSEDEDSQEEQPVVQDIVQHRVQTVVEEKAAKQPMSVTSQGIKGIKRPRKSSSAEGEALEYDYYPGQTALEEDDDANSDDEGDDGDKQEDDEEEEEEEEKEEEEENEDN